jgi:hypothetical protein
MGRLTATTVYLDEKQRKGLYRLARAKGSHFSEEIRAAIQQHLVASAQGPGPNPEELRRLAREAGQSVERMLKRLDDTNRRLEIVVRQVARSNRRALGGHR